MFKRLRLENKFRDYIMPYISIVIPTFNRPFQLNQALESLSKQKCDSDIFETIIIENSSKKLSDDIVKKFSSRIKNLKYFCEPSAGLHNARHRGIRESSGEIISFIDDDVIIPEIWVAGIQRVFKNNGDIPLAGGNCIPKFIQNQEIPEWFHKLWSENEFGKFMFYYSLLEFGNIPKKIPARYVFGCNFSIQKKILYETKGFHPDGFPEHLIDFRGDGETYIAGYLEKKNLLACFDPDLSLYHCIPSDRLNLEYLFTRAYNQGITKSYSDIRKYSSIKLPAIIKTFIKKNILDCRYFLDKNNVSAGLKKHFIKGYLRHSLNVYKNPDLFKWTIKNNYFTE